ncbi:hydrolase, TatD family [Caldalkalibacillus thermarum TA2.A1]|uniref:Hydrolase, TatD family n=1 Tax=Caldalkalibacillus thermarum (strain TA2.A1) TaxID=986075 RepID=F5L9X9_CALTT|nr:TatD family hydrolase [Caldalkalibacillus thermarum]EGL81849.1 hydrolase, TatD family [Caldalkalibacillus thermarum TA2.A1]QZT35266.1 TatD family hydrolase [Caldalkalibacillus thermarum TA2.A1]
MFFDTHAHINDARFDQDRNEVIERARAEGVSLIVNVGFNHETITATIRLAEAYDFIYAAVGWHPHDAKTCDDDALRRIEHLARTHPKVVAVGEMGLDYYWDHSPREVQAEVFRKQIDLAKRLKKPIIIHNREADRDVLSILKEEGADEVGGVMHCFGGDKEMARQCLELNFYISFGGPLTFKNAKLPKEVVQYVPLDRLLIETDCPYLAPHPLRGKRNEPAYVRYVAETMAELRGLSLEEIAHMTMENGKRLFALAESNEKSVRDED